jgi:preprotein translocase subunit YajC
LSSAYAYQTQVPPSPGRPEGPVSGAQVSQGTTQPSAPEQSAAPPSGGLLGSLPILLMIPLMFVFIWWNSRSQQKRQKTLLDSLHKGDRVVTQSGLIGKLAETGDRIVKIEIASGVRVEVLKSAIIGKDAADTETKK